MAQVCDPKREALNWGAGLFLAVVAVLMAILEVVFNWRSFRMPQRLDAIVLVLFLVTLPVILLLRRRRGDALRNSEALIFTYTPVMLAIMLFAR